jgi:hypothetical protein
LPQPGSEHACNLARTPDAVDAAVSELVLWCALGSCSHGLGDRLALPQPLRDSDGERLRLRLRLRSGIRFRRLGLEVEVWCERLDAFEKQAAEVRCGIEREIESGVARSQKPLVSLDTSDERRCDDAPDASLPAKMLLAAAKLMRLRFAFAFEVAARSAGSSTR